MFLSLKASGPQVPRYDGTKKQLGSSYLDHCSVMYSHLCRVRRILASLLVEHLCLWQSSAKLLVRGHSWRVLLDLSSPNQPTSFRGVDLSAAMFDVGIKLVIGLTVCSITRKVITVGAGAATLITSTSMILT